MKTTIKTFYLTLFSVISCNGQPQNTINVNTCQDNYEKANGYYKNFVFTDDTLNLKKSVVYYGKSIDCKETRSKSITNKINNLLLLKEYKQGYEFVDSLKIDDFSKVYKKEMYYNLFKGMGKNIEGDYDLRNKYYMQIVISINEEISRTKKDSIDIDSYADYYYVRSLFEEESQLKNEILSMGKRHPKYKEYFDEMISSYWDDNTE